MRSRERQVAHVQQPRNLRKWFRVSCLGIAAAMLLSAPATAQTPLGEDQKPCFLLPEGVTYDRSLPAPAQYLGFEIGERHVRHHQLVGYLATLAAGSERITYEVLGQSHGRRPYVMSVITSPENHARLAEIQAAHRRLANPATAAEVDLETLPAVIYMGYSVHGDESSAGNAVPPLAYHLVAGQGEAIEQLLRETVILLDPCLNPDGFDRFAAHANAYVGQTLNADSDHFEHTQPWPGGRVNYYWFDLNRDWLPVQHPESQARLPYFHLWKPNVVLDFHEMGTGSTYFFQPGVPARKNPLTPDRNVELTKQMAQYHAEALDAIGSLYFTEENFDDFYMGKGSTYPDLHGAVGILFEQASSRGHVQESRNGEVTFPFTIRNQFTCSLSSLQATWEMRQELLEYKRDFYRDSLDAGRLDPVTAYAFTAPGDRTRLAEFARILRSHDIECGWLSEPHATERGMLPAGETLVVPTEQPEYRFLLSLIERRTEFAENIFYDVSAWTLPLAFDLHSFAIQQPLPYQPVAAEGVMPQVVPSGDEIVAYAIPWTDYDAPRVLYQLLDAGLKVRVAERPFTVQLGELEQEFGYGTLVVPIGIQGHTPAEVAGILTAAQPPQVIPIATGLTPRGIDLGSNQFSTLEKPRVMMLIDGGVRRYDAGEVWHLLDTRLEMPLSLVAADRFGRIDLDDYNVIILSNGSYRDLLSGGGAERLQAWMREGGTLVATGSAISSLQSAGVIDVDFRSRNSVESLAKESESNTDADEDPRQKSYASARDERALDLISGAIFRTQVDLTHPLGWGFSDATLPVFRSNRLFLAPSRNPYANPVIYTENPLLGGYVSDENLQVLAEVVSVRVESVGRGRAILMSDNPNFRAFWYGTNRLFFNAIYFGQLVDVP